MEASVQRADVRNQEKRVDERDTRLVSTYITVGTAISPADDANLLILRSATAFDDQLE